MQNEGILGQQMMLDDFLSVLDEKLRFDCRQLAFCTHYSWFGLVKKEHLGIEETHLFYNRVPGLLSPSLLTFDVGSKSRISSLQTSRRNLPLSIEEEGDAGFRGKIAFIDTDILCYHAQFGSVTDASSVRATFHLPATEPAVIRKVRFDAQAHILTIETRTPATDKRDPDSDHALTICMVVPPTFTLTEPVPGGVVLSGSETVETSDTLTLTFLAPATALVGTEQTFVLGIGEGPTADIIKRRISGLESANSEATSNTWLREALGKFTFDGIDPEFLLPYATAAYQLLANTKAPRGQIGHNASYPSRGTYCAHYLWDACFTNLGVAQFNQKLAEGFLRILCENQEYDGKIPHFVCATWNRPGESQPPLIGWSAWRLYEQFGNKEFITDIYKPLERMVDWWFIVRDTDGDGLPEYSHRLESGWDDSPRFAHGRIAAVDLNAYLNREMRVLANISDILGKDKGSTHWKLRASKHAKQMHERLYDHVDGIFYDRLVDDDCLHKVLTPACFMPLWTEVESTHKVAHKMIANYLINPKHFFGAQPFPVVAYSDPNYQPNKWWCGPVWPNIAWAMAEILRIHGFQAQYDNAVERLLHMMSSHGEANELYNSATGEPLGAPGLCWGDSILMALARQSGQR